jgi:hypothetical protein
VAVYFPEDGYFLAGGDWPEDVVWEVFAVAVGVQPAAVQGGAVAGEAGQAAVGALMQAAWPDVVPEDAELAVRDGPDVPARKQKSKYFLPTTGVLCVSFLIARWAARFFPCYLIL